MAQAAEASAANAAPPAQPAAPQPDLLQQILEQQTPKPPAVEVQEPEVSRQVVVPTIQSQNGQLILHGINLFYINKLKIDVLFILKLLNFRESYKDSCP